ncbi:MAG: NUDIX domain-containing protein [Patescibacteria group bacterium]|nr:NUDIX domain-containing protein [Patescibacteria group bacterium]
MPKTVICHDQYGKLYKVNADKLTFRPSIYGLLIEGDKILLSPGFGGYDFPGGGAELHETIEDTLKREFWEETGFKVKPLKLLRNHTSFFYAVIRKQYWNCLCFYFLVKRVGGKLSKTGFDESEKKYADLAEWIKIEEINKIKFINSLGDSLSKKLIKSAFYAKK